MSKSQLALWIVPDYRAAVPHVHMRRVATVLRSGDMVRELPWHGYAVTQGW